MSLEFFDKIIETVKETAKPGDIPMAWFKNKDDKIIVSALATGEKASIKLALYTFMLTHQATEVIFATEAWFVQREGNVRDFEGQVKDQPDVKECFIVCYFSKDKEYVQQLPFIKKKKGRKEIAEWVEAPKYKDLTNSESRFNPYKMTSEEVEQFRILTEIDIIKVNGKKEVHNLKFGCKFIVYRHDGKACFECLNKKGEVFVAGKPTEDNEGFKKQCDEALKMLELAGGLA